MPPKSGEKSRSCERWWPSVAIHPPHRHRATAGSTVVSRPRLRARHCRVVLTRACLLADRPAESPEVILRLALRRLRRQLCVVDALLVPADESANAEHGRREDEEAEADLSRVHDHVVVEVRPGVPVQLVGQGVGAGGLQQGQVGDAQVLQHRGPHEEEHAAGAQRHHHVLADAPEGCRQSEAEEDVVDDVDIAERKHDCFPSSSWTTRLAIHNFILP